ncbi:MAG: hypothetical protein RIS44_2926 [Pseudomonadota bacterium]|jgi:hypothetical protein
MRALRHKPGRQLEGHSGFQGTRINRRLGEKPGWERHRPFTPWVYAKGGTVNRRTAACKIYVLFLSRNPNWKSFFQASAQCSTA